MKKTLALILALLMLCTATIATVSAEEATDWKKLTGDLGLHVYVGAPMEVSPVIDGVVNDGEYSYVREWTPDDIINYDVLELREGVTEYIAHDANYIYYAASFKQLKNNRAFQFKFKTDNTFAIFNAKSDDPTIDELKHTLYQRVNWQLRYMDDGTTSLYQMPTWHYSMNVRPPRAAGSTRDLEYAATRTAENIKTYEIKLSKAYIAEYAGCTVEEVSVVPYMTSFHDVCSLACVYDEAMTAQLIEAGATRAEQGNLFIFMVLEEDPANIPPATEATTTEATTTAAPETEATTAEATTTAATTTAAPATTAAEEAKGCKSSLAVSALVMIPTLAGGALLIKRRKED